MVELRALRLVHRHGKHCLGRLQPAGQHPANATAAPLGRKRHPQPATLSRQRNAHVTIHQPQLVVVAGDDHRPTRVPPLTGRQQARRLQPERNLPVQPLHPPASLAQRTQQLEAPMGLQHPGRPVIEGVLPGLVRRTVPVHPPQVMRVPHRPLISRHPIQPAMNHQLPQRIPTLGVHLDPGDIGHLARRTPCTNLVPQTLHPGHLAIVDQGCQTADAAVRPEAMAVTQHADALVQQRAIFCPVSLQPAVDGLLRHPGHPVGRLRPVASLAGMGTQLTQNGTRLHRRQLVLVPQQDEPCPGRQRMHHLRHHLQVDHRGLVDHQHVQRQRITRVMPEMPRARPAAQQPVQRRDGPRNGRPDRLALGHVL